MLLKKIVLPNSDFETDYVSKEYIFFFQAGIQILNSKAIIFNGGLEM